MRGKKPFKFAVNILALTGLATIIWYFWAKNTPFGDLFRKFVYYIFVFLIITTIIAYLNWSEAKRLV